MWSDLLNTHSAVCIRLIDVSFDFCFCLYTAYGTGWWCDCGSHSAILVVALYSWLPPGGRFGM